MLYEVITIKFEFDFFLQIFVVLVGLFMTWFFVAGLPTEFESLEAQRGHPKGRITSYNVCYTKLLREKVAGIT